MRHFMTLLMVLVAPLASRVEATQTPTEPLKDHLKPQAREIDLAKPFQARSPWRFLVTEGPPTHDFGENDAPGALTLCLRKNPIAPCVSDPVTPPLRPATQEYQTAWEPHYLLTAKVVTLRGNKATPLLLIVTGSLNSGDGDQLVATQLVRYDRAQDEFQRIYAKAVGHNNNQEVRVVTHGPLQGSVITAQPQAHLPYGYWITVDKPNSAGTYRQVLRYRSATLYNDGNTLAVIDSEMPNIERRLGLWKPGMPLPTPLLATTGKSCIRPILKHTELWCG